MIAHPSLGNFLREITIMAKPSLPAELWEVIEPLLPKWTPSPKGGEPPVTDRAALTGILFVLKTGIPWEDLLCEMNCGCGMTCWRRLRDWQTDGTWDKIPKFLLDRLRGADKINWSRALIDSSFVRAAYGGEKTGPSPVDRTKPGRKHHVITDASGIPLASSVTAANVNDITQLAPSPTPSRRWRAGSATRERSPTPYRGTRPMTPSRIAGDCGRSESRRSCPRRGSTTRAGRVRPAGRWSGPWTGSTRTGGCASVTNVGQTSIKRSSHWPALKSVRVHYLLGSVRQS
jgi:transposase